MTNASDDHRKRELLMTDEGAVKATFGNACLLVRELFGDTLRYNKMALSPWLNDDPLDEVDVGVARELFEAEHCVAFSKEVLLDAISLVANEAPFHPVQEFLGNLKWDGVARLDRVADEILFSQSPLAALYLRKFFLMAVARALNPGCKVDNVLILQGEQGFKKSTFFSTIAAPWFSDTWFDITTRQAYLTLGASWIYEFQEIDTLIGTREDSDIKRFITTREDTFVPPYGRAAIRQPRSSVIVGTTNQSEFFKDSTGNRRHLVVVVGGPVNIPVLESWREQLWAEAAHAYLGGEQHWLTPEQEGLQREANKSFELPDPWLEIIEGWLDSRAARYGDRIALAPLTAAEVLTDCFDLPKSKHDLPTTRRLGRVLRALGFTRRQHGAARERVWLRGKEAPVEH